ncbi:epoxide hydrolase [Leptolyngbya sp. FACHB-671]|uniref:epoxide hydrolase family protein n=1 Tax=Leptolyngbya sp. FACHB-671 TaxID=2692812 RepID=UPI00168802EC|nr:epoxide hydrolase family protein [Leptolyngbya sp. FACHB-671]MBD2068209.1 epoxide hydrolase [Leptolyngbya sp. FACHB-671]
MTQLKKVRYPTKTRTIGAFVFLSRFLVALFVATVFLAPLSRVLAQQPTQSGAQAQVVTEAIATKDNTLRPWGNETATTQLETAQSTDTTAIRPFQVHVPQEAIDDLRQRIVATRWPDQETVADQSQGVQLATMQELVRYWGTEYDWRKAEAKLNALPQFITNIDGLDIHFIHVRSQNPNALPLLITHGWPGSVIEQLKVIGPLTDPTAYGGQPEDAFDLVIPSIPGYGFSGKPTGIGWDPDRIAQAWAELMQRLGYTRYVAQGGDWGSPITSAMARQAPAGLLGVHLNLPATIPPEIATVLASGNPAPADLSEQERAAFDSLDTFNKKDRAYAVMMGTRPQTVGYGLSDSPAGLAAWLLGHPGFAQWTSSGDDSEKSPTKDEVLDDITLYWLTNSAVSSARLYWENKASLLNAIAQKTNEISLPVSITVFPGEIYQAPETWARRAYRNLIYFHEAGRGGHFAAWEEPQLFSEEIRAAFRSLR